MPTSWILYRYLGVQFLGGVAMTLFGVAALVFLIDMVEMLRVFAGKHDAAFGTVIVLVFLKLPYLLEQVVPFAFLFGAMWTLSRLSRNQELVVVRSAGVSAWQFLTPALFISLTLGLFLIAAFNPIASDLYSRFHAMESDILGKNQDLLDVSENGFWLRQGYGETHSIIHAKRTFEGGARLEDVKVYVFENVDDWVRRINASRAELKNGFWELYDARTLEIDRPGTDYELFKLRTSLTKEKIQESFADPDTISFWALPGFIAMTEAAGFSALNHKMHFHSMLSLPLLLCAMVLIAASVSIRYSRSGGTSQLIMTGVLAGFALYFVSDISRALGISGNMPITVAAWAPTFIAMLLGLTSLFYLEDG